jgi:hypothetical protein
MQRSLGLPGWAQRDLTCGLHHAASTLAAYAPSPSVIGAGALTVLEQATLRALVASGEALMGALRAQRASAELPEALTKALDAYSLACAGGLEEQTVPLAERPEVIDARTALEVEVRASVGVMERGELVVRALAFLGGLDPEALRDEIKGAELKLHVVPPSVPCPCASARVAAGTCSTCHGSRFVATVIPPEHRVHTEAEYRQRFEARTASSGPSPFVLADASGRAVT